MLFLVMVRVFITHSAIALLAKNRILTSPNKLLMYLYTRQHMYGVFPLQSQGGRGWGFELELENKK